MKPELSGIYGHKVRVRACGLCQKDDQLLLINHAGVKDGEFWSPPGGGIEFGESAETAVEREFREETGLTINVDKFLFACEFIHESLHAIELFFEVTYQSGKLSLGIDPETPTESVLKEVRWFASKEIQSLSKESLHGAFTLCKTPMEITELRGYFRI